MINFFFHQYDFSSLLTGNWIFEIGEISRFLNIVFFFVRVYHLMLWFSFYLWYCRFVMVHLLDGVLVASFAQNLTVIANDVADLLAKQRAVSDDSFSAPSLSFVLCFGWLNWV